LNDGNDTFIKQTTYPTDATPRSVRVENINGDDELDIVVANTESNNVGIFLNKGDGNFTDQRTYSTNSNPFSIIITDVNDNNKLDIIMAHRNSVGILYIDFI